MGGAIRILVFGRTGLVLLYNIVLIQACIVISGWRVL